ncbi:MAG: hypothetical protein JST17_10770 [Bacteroidetes bacterium]|nr:hypothetical protein [Bacteroidota bacterium]MBS1930378.1 hypothetical protein [Bacteroidota bacterium]
MKHLFFVFLVLVISISVFAQREGDTVLKHCPVFITDTAGYNNYFIEALPATITVDKSKGILSVVVSQKDQFFSLFFGKRKLENRKYIIKSNADSKREVAARYSFRSDGQVSYVTVTSGTVECSFNKESQLWNLKVVGVISNYVGRSISYFNVKAILFIP